MALSSCHWLPVDQRAESALQWGGPHVGVQTLSIDPMAPWLFATGGNDTLGEWLLWHLSPLAC